MSSERQSGTCHICGNYLPLTYEHLPPRSAFNDETAHIFDYLDWTARDAEGNMSGGTTQQRGWGAYTLCESCNNNTGSWYVPALTQMARSGLAVLTQLTPDEIADQRRGEIQGATVEFSEIYPLRFLKQIITMLLSANHAQFGIDHPELTSLVLNRRQTGLSERYKFYLSFFRGPLGRMIGSAKYFNGRSWSNRSEVAFPPFSYIMTIDSPEPILPVGDISNFANYDYDERVDMQLELVVGFGHTPIPGDFRTSADIAADVAQSEEQ